MGKKANKKKNEKLYEEMMKIKKDNDFISSINPNTLEIEYIKDIYFFMSKLLKQGKTATEAYQELGFPLEVFGEERALKVSYKAIKLSRDEKFGTRISDFSGEYTLDPKWDLTEEELEAFYKSQIEYLAEKRVEMDKQLKEMNGKMAQMKLEILDSGNY